MFENNFNQPGWEFSQSRQQEICKIDGEESESVSVALGGYSGWITTRNRTEALDLKCWEVYYIEDPDTMRTTRHMITDDLCSKLLQGALRQFIFRGKKTQSMHS